MSRIAAAFARQGRTALIPYVTVGYPTLEDTIAIVTAMAEAGADLVELGIPFSDPLADGITIQRASHQALLHGVKIDDCLETAARLRRLVDIPLVFMTYYNPVLRYGLDLFCGDAAQAGADGLIVPDLPPDEGAELERATARRGLDLIYLLAPTSTPERIDLVAQHSRGFIYLVSLTGVTGARDDLPAELEGFVARVRARAKQPLCVGFGISNPQQAHRVAQVADGIIVGSRIIQLVEDNPDPVTAVSAFIKSLREVL